MPTMRNELPNVWLVGDAEHPEFTEATAMLGATARITSAADVWQAVTWLPDAPLTPELIVVAVPRPGVIRRDAIERLRRAAPLAGIVTLLGSWCEGETRTGRPPAGVHRLYWYDFPNWWRRQLAARNEGCCPEWSYPDNGELRFADGGLKGAWPPVRLNESSAGLVVVDTQCRKTADAIADVLQSARFSTVGHRLGRSCPSVRGVTAGIWEGRQLDGAEVPQLASFCRHLARDAAPVVAMLDFPRGDRVMLAREVGAAAVLGKPWLNVELIETLRLAIDRLDNSEVVRVASAV